MWGRGSAGGGDGNALRGPAMARGAARMGVGHMEVGRGDTVAFQKIE